jgi:hypothetical protein
MLNSRIIEVDGIFLGAAVSLPAEAGWRFVAADTRVGSMDGVVTTTVRETQRMAKQALLAARMVRPLTPLAIS